MTTDDPDHASLRDRRARILGPAYRLFYRDPVHIVRGRGTLLYDADGTEYLDAYNNVPAVGHCHPRVVEAQAHQASVLNTHTRYLSTDIVEYAERLVATFPKRLSSVMFTCTGSESVDLALRVARYGRSGSGMIVTENAYHGTTAAAASISPSLGAGMPLGADVRVVPVPSADDGAGDRFAADVVAAIADLNRHGHGVAALVADTILSSDGVHPDPPGLFGPAVDAVREAGGVFIADEVQPGFGRTGKGMWGFARHNVVPDLVVMGKPMGNGIPIAAMVAQADLLDEFGSNVRYFNTFGGNPVAIAAADAVLDVIEDEELITNASSVGHHLLSELRSLTADHAVVGDIRGEGLFIGLDLVDTRGVLDPATADLAANLYREHHVLVGVAGRGGTSVKIRPPLPFSYADADRFLEVTSDILPKLNA